MIIESLRMSWENIITNKLRSFLTMLGIVIGVASVIALITIVQGATNSITDQISGLGVNKITVTAMGTPLKQGLNDEDISQVASLDNIIGVSPTVSGKISIVYDKTVMENLTIQGKNDVYFKNDPDIIKTGRGINVLDLENKNQVAIIGSNIVNELFYGVDPIGSSLLVNGTTYSIIGTLSSSSAFGEDTDKADDTVVQIENVLDSAFNYKDNAYSVFNMGDMITSFQTITSMMTLLLAGIAAISLVVGGIGIMNMMLVSVTERRMEIGLRKALGATPGTIQLQFIIESIFLSIFGGIIGLLLGALIAYVAASFIGTSFAIALSTVYIALGFSAGVGIIFGYMPARKASRLNPIDALRSL